MKRGLEEFTRDNRDAFDHYQPGTRVWKAIEDELPSNNKAILVHATGWMKWASIAAAIAVIISTVVYFSRSAEAPAYVKAEIQVNDLPAEYSEEVYHFTKLIEIKHKQLQKIEKEQPELYHQFSGDIAKLDSNYQALRKELPGHPNQEMLIKAMIGNLRWQIDLLNEQLNIIQKIEHSKKPSHEKIFKSA